MSLKTSWNGSYLRDNKKSASAATPEVTESLNNNPMRQQVQLWALPATHFASLGNGVLHDASHIGNGEVDVLLPEVLLDAAVVVVVQTLVCVVCTGESRQGRLWADNTGEMFSMHFPDGEVITCLYLILKIKIEDGPVQAVEKKSQFKIRKIIMELDKWNVCKI